MVLQVCPGVNQFREGRLKLRTFHPGGINGHRPILERKKAFRSRSQKDTSAGSVTRMTDWSPVFFFQAARIASILARFSGVSG